MTSPPEESQWPLRLAAGARSLLVSTWRVEDRAPALFMQRFYSNLVDAPGTSKARALRDAQSWLRNYVAPDGSMPYRHPIHWAGYVVIGASD